MLIEHKRVANVKRGSRAYCISHVYIDGVYSHDAIEDYDRGLNQSMTESQAAKIKIKSQTAIPIGTYKVKMNIQSPKFNQKPFYKQLCLWPLKNGGKLTGCVPRLDPVVGFSGILIHCGTNEYSSAGCVIVGYNKKVGEVCESTTVFKQLYQRMLAAAVAGETITYIITRSYKV